MDRTSERLRIETRPKGPGFTLLDLVGAADGPCLVVLGGVHGDEPPGVRGATALANRLDGLDVRGRVRIVPVCHEAAFGAATRTSPIDGRNLARAFPGDSRGSATQQLAALLDEAVLAEADILIDLHSAGIHYAMPTLVGYCDDGSPASLEAARLAEASGMPVVWRHPGAPPAGRTGTGPHARGVPFLYFESTDDQDEAAAYADAVMRVMAASGMLDVAPPAADEEPLRLYGSGDLDAGGVLSPRTGLVHLEVDVMDRVSAGQRIATVAEPGGNGSEPVTASDDGIVAMRRRTSWLSGHDLVVFLTAADGRRDP